MNDESIKINKYNKYLDNIVITIIIATVILITVLLYLWLYHVPNKKTTALKINYQDDRDPSTFTPPSDTDDYLSQQTIKLNNNPTIGNYQKAQLRQFCSQTNNDNVINIPSEFKYQECDDGLKCTSGILEQGPICLVDIGNNCNDLDDCVPSADVCLQGRCVVIDENKKINISCQSDFDCQYDIFEDKINNHICFKFPGQTVGSCKVNLFPFDGGCQLDNECPVIENHSIKCVQSNTYKDTLFSGEIICDTVDGCTEGNGMSVKLDVDFDLKFLTNQSSDFMIKIIPNAITDENDQYYFTIPQGGVSNTTKILNLIRSEFKSYIHFNDKQGVSISFGDFPNVLNFFGKNKNDGGPYGICLDLLPIGSPSNLTIGNITIPGISPISTASIDNKIMPSNRKGRKGKLLEICFNDSTDEDLSCGETFYLNQNWSLECGYNYQYQQSYLENLFYGLSPRSFNLDNLGSCMIKRMPEYQICDNANKGCVDPLICSPLLDPITNQINNYCIVPLDSQKCQNNVCPEGYKCGSDNYCFSEKNNLTILDSDCIKGNASGSNNFELFVYNQENDQYFSLNLNSEIKNYLSENTIIENVVLKLGTCYATVNNFSQVGLEKKTILPKDILIYGPDNNTDTKKTGVLISLNSAGQYQTNKNFSILPSADSSIYDINLVEDKLAVIQKRTITGLRELAYKVEKIDNGFLFLTSTSADWVDFNMFANGETYEYYLYSTSGTYNNKGTAVAGVANSFYEKDIFELLNYSGPEYYGTGEDIFIIINSNKLAFNNNLYYNTYAGQYTPFTNPFPNPAGGKKILLPTGFYSADKPDNPNIIGVGEDFFMLPKVYRNQSDKLSPDYQRNYTPLENGDRLKFNDKFTLWNIKVFSELSTTDYFEEITVEKDTYLYIEKVQNNVYYDFDVGWKNLANVICNLHTDFLASEGSVPYFDNKPIYNMNLGQNSNGLNLGVSFSVFDDMVNYNINFISFEDLKSDITITDNSTFIKVNNSGDFYMGNGINNGITYNFENDTKMDFKFYSEGVSNYIMVTSAVKGSSDFHNYVQKIQYDLDIKASDTFNVTGENYYDYFYQNKIGDNYNNIKFKYHNQIIAPKANSFYFDSSINVNTINNVEENLFDNNENEISIFTTFNNDKFIEETGYVQEAIFNSATQNIYSNKSPPVASYSRLNDFVYETSNDDINFKFKNYNKYVNYIEIDQGISLDYNTQTNCLGEGENFITLRDAEIIKIFLSNPSSEIVLQKQGDSLESYYLNQGVSNVLVGADHASKQVKNHTTKNNIYQKNQWYDQAESPLNYGIKYEQTNLENTFKNKNIEINRSVVSIENYNVYVDNSGKVNEFMVIRLNAPVDNNDPYIKNCFNNSSKWKIYPYNIVPLTYYIDLDAFCYSYDNALVVDYPKDAVTGNLMNVLDGSALWSGTKSSEIDLNAINFSNTSYNKLLFNEGDNFYIYNLHDEYFYKFDDPFAPFIEYTELKVVDITSPDNFRDAGANYIESVTFINQIFNSMTAPTDPFPALLTDESLVPFNDINLYGQNPSPVDTASLRSNNSVLKYTITYSNYKNTLVLEAPSAVENIRVRSLPKKLKIFDITTSKQIKQLYIHSTTSITDHSWFVDIPAKDFVNEDFLYFKKKYTNSIILPDFNNLLTKDTVFNGNPSSPYKIINLLGNNNSDKIYNLNSYNTYYSSPTASGSKNISSTIANTRSASNSFKLAKPYHNTFKPIYYEDTGIFVNAISYVLDGYYELMFYSLLSASKTTKYNFIANLEIRPVYSSSINVPQRFNNYDKTLYMINNLFLSTLPKQVINNKFNYLNIGIINDFIISSLFYVNHNTTKITKRKGLGTIAFNINSSPNFVDENNLVNYDEVRFPSWFTERLINSFNSIPLIKNIFTSIREGNIYEKMKYFAYLNYTLKDSANNQILFLTTNVDSINVFENKGIPYSVSLNEDKIIDEQLINTIKFEPYNKLLFALAYYCI